ncbi:MAG: tRNA dihydrouridine synthase DusB [Burkholderiales bacterium]|nr:tRNA dihydrouridine synthase DusB [Burkholderiales bacterium]
MLQIGKIKLPGNLVLSPMAGVTDAPYRYIARLCGASYTISEMITSQLHLWSSYKTQNRLQDLWEPPIKILQIAGASPEVIVDAAIKCEEIGASIIEINMGCPAKKVCNVLAGSALLKDEDLVKKILHAVTKAVSIPIILKTRLGWSTELPNIETIAQIAEAANVQALTIHGRARDQLYNGTASYDLIAKVKQKSSIPVFANGDIISPEKAKEVIEYTKVDGLYIGRAALGNPWIFKQIEAYLTTGTYTNNNILDKKQIIIKHLECIFLHYPEVLACGYARKHIKWYLVQLYSKDKANLIFTQFINLQALTQFIVQVNLCIN